MADYKISLGAEVRTSEINKQVNNYKGDIKVGAILDTSGITAELNSYRPPKPIEVKSKLNTEGIKNAIQNYKTDRLRAIMATSDLDTTGIDNKIAAYNQAPKTITIDTTLDEKSITRQINAYNKSGQAPTITVSAELSDNAIGDAIKKFDTSNQLIKINVQPVFDGFDAADAEKLLDGYTARVPLKVNLELNKTHINQQITDYNATALSDNGRTITLKAKLTDTAVADAISNYKTSNADKLKIPVDLTFSKDSKAELNAFDAELQKRIASYEGTPVDIPVRLKPANGKSFTSQITKLPVYIDAVLKNADDINNALNVYENSPVPVAAKLVPGKNFASDITKTPIKVEAEIIPDSINKALTNPAKPFNKIPIGVTLTLKDTNDINKQVKQLAPFATEMLNLDVKLNDESVNAAIAKSKPATPLDVNIKLLDDDINKQIEAIHPTSQIKVNVKVNDGDVDEKTGKQKAQESILVNVQLDRDDINRQIEAIRPTSKIKVGVQLDFATHKDKDTKEVIQKGIAQQIKEYETKSKVKVGVELDEDSVNTSVRNFNTDVPIKLGVELDTEPAEKRIEELKAEFKKFGNITINFAGSGGGSSVGDGNGSGGSAQNVAQQFREADIQIESTHDQVENLKNALSNIGFNTNSIDAITKEFENLEISVRNVTSRLRDDGSTTLTIKGLDKFGRTVKSMRSIDEKGNVTNLGTTISQDFKETENAFKRLKSLGKEISKLDIKIAGLDADKNKQEIAELIAQLNKLEAEYNDLFDITENNLSASQIDELAQDIASGSSKVAATKARVADKAAAQKAKEEAKEINDAYISIYNTKKRIGDLEVELIGAEAKGDAETVKSINDEITRLKNNLSTLDKDGAYSSRFTDEQNSTLNELNEYTQYRKNHAKSQIADKTALKETENAFKRLKELGKEISQLDIEIAKLDPDKDIAEIDKLTARLKKLEAEYDSLFDSTETNLTGGQIDELLRDIENGGDKLDILKAKLKDAKTALATKIDINLNDGTVAKQVKNVTSEFDKIKNKLPELQIAMDGFNEALAKLNIAKDYEGEDRVEKLIAAYQEYERALKAVKNQLDINKTAEKDAVAKAKLEDDRLAFQSKIDAWLTKNSAAAKLFGDDLLELRKQAESCDRVKLDHLEREFKRIDTEAEAAGKKMKTFPDRIKEQFQKYSSYFSIASVFMYAEQAMRSMFEQVKLIDSAMTELKKVTNETDASYNNFLGNAASRAKELGTTIDGLVASTADFARLGYGFQESQKLAEVANIYAVVGDEIEGVEDATQSLVSTMAAFKNDMNGMSNDDFAMSIVDKMNEVSNNFAISSGGIGQALQRSASSMAAANNTLDETIAMITAANEVAQNPEKVGNAMKTMSMRIRGAKTELEEAGESTDGMAESTASLRAEIKALSGVDIMLDANTFKSTYQIMDELSRKWENLSDIQQATIIELVAGKHQGNVFSSLMANFDTARAALDTSLNSSGSAMEEHAKWSESLEARLNRLKAAWQSLSQTFMNSSFLKVSMDAITGLVNVIDKLLDSLGSFGTIGLGVGIYSLIKSGGLKTFFKSLSAFSTLIPTFNTLGGKVKAVGTSIGDAGRLAKASMGSFSAWTSAIGIAVTVVSALYNAYKNAKEAAAEARQEAIQASDEYLDAASTFEQAYIKYSGRTDLTLDEEEELASAINGTVDALGDKSSALQSIVTSSNDYLASLEAIKKAELESAKNAAEEKQEKVAENLREAAIGWESWDGSEVDIRLGGSEAANIAEEIGGNFFKAIESEITGPRGGQFKDKHYKLELSGDADASDMVAYYNTLLKFKEELKDAGLEESADYTRVKEAIDAMADSIGSYVDATYEAVKANYQLGKGIPTTVDEYIAMREAILSDSELDSFSVGQKMSILNSLDSEYRQLFDLSSVEAQARKFVGIIKGYGDGTKDGVNEIGTVETFLNMRTAVNNNECTVGQYLSELNNVKSMSAKFSDEEQKEFNLAFGIDTDAIKEQYDNVYNYLSRNYLNKDTRTMDRDEERYYKLDVREYQKQIREFLNTLSSSELAALVSIKPEIDWENATEEEIRKLIEEQVKIDEALSFKTDIEVDTTALETLNTALTESASAIGLTEDSIDSLKSKYSNLEGYNPHTLFEKTANGVKLNRDEVAKLEKKYNDLKKTEVQEHLDTLVSEYNKCTEAIDSNIGSNEKLELISKREKYAEQIEELAEYQAQLEGVTGAYQRWIDAQAGPEDYEGYESIATSREGIKDEIKRGFISNASKEYIDLLSGEDLQGGTIDDYANAWAKLDDKITGAGHSINDFFTVNDDGDITATGIDRFFKSLQTDFKGSVAEFDKETGKWQYNFSQENLQKIQDEWGIGIDAIELLLEAAAAAGYDVDWDGVLDNLDLDTSSFETLVSYAEKAQKELNKLEGYEDLSFNFATTNVKDATTEIEKAQKAYSEIINKDGKVKLKAEGAEQMRVVLSTLLVQKQQLEDSEIALNVSTSGLDEAQAKAVAWVQDFRTKYKNLEIAISTGEGIDEAKTELETVKTSLGELDGDTAKIAAQLVLGEGTDTSGDGFKTQVSNAIDSIGKQDINAGFKLDETGIGGLNSKLLTNFTVDATATITKVDKSQLETVETDGMVNWNENTDNVSKSFEANGTVNWDDNVDNVKKSFSANGTVKWTSGNKVKVDVISEASGTAHSGGTASGRAFARGDWGIKGSGTALGGELGRRNCDHT